MQKNRRSSVVLLGALLALLSGCDGKAPESGASDAAVVAAEPHAAVSGNDAGSGASACRPATVEDLVGPTWTVDNAWCGIGCDHTHVEVGNKIAFTKSGAKFDVHGRFETSGGALESIGALNNEVRGRVPAPHASGSEVEHWFAAQIYLEDESRCATPTPYDLRIAVCKNMPDSYDACQGDGQHGGYGHAHP